MSAKKKIDANQIIDHYMSYVLEHGHRPKTIYQFAKDNKFEESSFYQHFGSFEALEKAIFQQFFTHTIDVLEKSDSYGDFDPREKLLAFYFTFFELLAANRSYVMFTLHGSNSRLQNMSVLEKLRSKFKHYISELPIEMLDLKHERLERIQVKGLQESAWLQLLVTMKFWMDDDSAAFEKTDVFIEKSVNASFDMIHVRPIKSVIDLGKFLVKEKLNIA